MQKLQNIKSRRGFIDPATLALLGLGALGVFQWQDSKTNARQDSELVSNRQAIRQVSSDLDYLGHSYADWRDGITEAPARQEERQDWRVRITPIGSVEYIKN